MTKSVPTAISLPKLGELLSGKNVLASTFADMLAAQHYIYGRQGAHILNAVFDPPWLSLDYASGGDAYHAVGQSVVGGMTLDQVTGLFRFERRFYNTGAAATGYNLQLNVYAQNLSVRATVTRLDTEDGLSSSATAFTGLVTTHGADSEWDTVNLEFTDAQASRSGSSANGLAYFLVYCEGIVPASGDGQIHHISLRETPITAAVNLPRGA